MSNMDSVEIETTWPESKIEDLAKTLAYLKGQTSPDGSFVEVGENGASVEACRFGYETSRRAAMELGLNTELRTWVAARRMDDGSFRSQVDSERGSLSSTYYAVRVFRLLNATTELDVTRSATTAWLQAQWSKPENQNIDELYYLIRALHLLDAETSTSLKGAWIDFIKSCRSGSNGYANKPGEVGDIEHSYCSIHALLLLGVPAAGLGGDAAWISDCVRPDGGIQWSPNDPTHSHATLYWGAHLIYLLKLPHPWEATAEFVSSSINADGGYGLNGSNLWHSYCAVSTALLAEISLGRASAEQLVIE